jgi:phosphoribosylformylglycinamidine cyclo-ligase
LGKPDKQPTQHTYREAGVDIDANDRLKEIICQHARTTFTPGVISDIGFFGSLFELKGYKQPILVSSADGVGTKIKIACALGNHEGIGMDIVNHCVNDILTCGASPLFFLDYVAMSKMDASVVASIVKGMAEACKDVDCALIGGETAEMPGLYPQGEYDLVGFIVGGIEKSQIKNGGSIVAGDVLIGLPSSGLHTNGYSLVRRVFDTDNDPSKLKQRYPQLGRTLGDALLEPHRCYYQQIKPLLPEIKGLAHITGGGFPGNLPRTLPKSVAAVVDKSSWEVPPLFSLIQRTGNIEDDEMYRVFNMGIGMILICDPTDTAKLMKKLPHSKVIGEIVKRKSNEERTRIV